MCVHLAVLLVQYALPKAMAKAARSKSSSLEKRTKRDKISSTSSASRDETSVSDSAGSQDSGSDSQVSGQDGQGISCSAHGGLSPCSQAVSSSAPGSVHAVSPGSPEGCSPEGSGSVPGSVHAASPGSLEGSGSVPGSAHRGSSPCRSEGLCSTRGGLSPRSEVGVRSNSASNISSSDSGDSTCNASASSRTSSCESQSISCSGSGASSRSPSRQAGTGHEDLSTSSEDEAGGAIHYEICCAEDSLLTQCGLDIGLCAKRRCLETGHDFDKRETAVNMVKKIEKQDVAAAWASPECRYFSPLQNLQKKTQRYMRRLKRNRRKSKRQVRNCVLVLVAVMAKGGRIYFEWPQRSQGWGIGPLRMLRKLAKRMGQELRSVTIHGCAYGMKNEDRTKYLKKSWRILTNDAKFEARIGRTCPRNHKHAVVQGRETRQSAFYPRPMCKAIANHWAQLLKGSTDDSSED